MKGMKKWPICMMLCIGMLGIATQVFADKLAIRYSDPQGDNTGKVDVSSMELRFDSVSGEYVINVTADPAQPFDGECLLNVNIWNPDAGTFFQDTFPGIDNLDCPTGKTFTLSGISGVLSAWQANDRVATSSNTELGNPPGTTLFRSSVADWVDGDFVNCVQPFPNICDEDAIAAQEVFIIQKEVPIDIRPFGKPNKPNVIRLHSKGVIWVAILSDTFSESPFDPPSQVDLDTVEFGPDGARANRHKVRDINKDGLGDLVLRFRISETGIGRGDTEATLNGATYDGLSITGTDSIKTKCRKH